MAGKYATAVLDGSEAEKTSPKYANRVLGEKTLGQDVPQKTGEPLLDPEIVERGTFLPFGRTKSGETEWALPEIAVEILHAISLPGKALRGDPITEIDVTRAALVIGMPALRGIGGTALKRVPQRITRKQVKGAPTTGQLKEEGAALFQKVRGSDAVISLDSYQNALAKLETSIFKSGFDSALHPIAASALKAISKRLGSELDMQDLMIVRRQIKNAANSLNRDEARIGSKMVAHIDDYVNGLTADDLVSGSAEKAGETLKKARRLWAKMSKSEEIDDIFEYARNQASGFENGLRIGFRALLKDKRRIKGFTKDEVKAMREVVAGNFTRNVLKRLGKLGPGTGQQTNMLGFGLGSGGGAAVGSAFGPIGAAAGAIGVPVLAHGAQKLGERGTRLAAEKARALAAGVRPRIKTVPYGTQGVQRGALGLGVGAEAGRVENQLERMRRPR
ncbi:hypothetical protein LCGC14_0355140 [marine sediment metagenome]|uniref:Uncharacterized protein n=1 Tax=marine sediment metagenome TaxID=412755 RepID=A0A0F9TFB0_9ZZZZ